MTFWKKKTIYKQVEFVPTGAHGSHITLEDLEFLPEPKPAKNFIPSWYKDATFFKGMQKFDPKKISFIPPVGFKACVSFLDGITIGYTLVTWVDIFVLKSENNQDPNNSAQLHWQSPVAPLEVRDTDLNPTLPIPLGCAPTHLAWKMPWGVKLPKGYSAFYTHPVNRHDLPFVTLSGVIDCDKFFSGGNLPVFFKKDFFGKIPAGTPFVQIIPFKRESWKSRVNKDLFKNAVLLGQKSRTVHYGWYKKHFWSKKEFS